MAEQPMFSIIVPVYRVENYLDTCVRSLVDQSFPDLEIILVDDGSPDRCPAMCDAWARRDARITVLHKENGGQADARNRGIDMAKGTYLVFVDSDDYLSGDMLEKLVPYAAQNGDIIVMDAICEGGNKPVIHHVGKYGAVFTGPEYLKEAYRTGAMPMANFLYVYRREFLLEQGLRYLCGVVHEDDHLVSRAFLLAKRVIDSGVQEYHYVIRENSTTTRRDMRNNGRDIYRICMDLREIFESIEDPELKTWMIDSLVTKYLFVFQAGRLYQYGTEFIHKDFVRRNALRKKTRIKGCLFCLSPWLYWHINNLTKSGKR